MTKLYAAPMEGLTTCLWRQVHREIFGGADRYYTPFLSPNANREFQTKELREVTGGEQDLVPQLITNRAEYFIWGARELQKLGYDEVNFNLGCPSGTVVAKHKGSGLLTDPEELDAVLEEIFRVLPDMKISVKTRIGRYDAAEWEALLAVYEKYPIAELTVHLRVQKEFYNGTARRELFCRTMERTHLPLAYNGDVTTPDDEALTWGCPVMVGRGLLMRPALFREIKGGAAAAREELIAYHDTLLEGYRKLFGDLPAIHKMREMWNYLSLSFADTEPYLKRIRKAKTLSEYFNAAQSILHECEMI